ncbi:MAG: glycosyltransferase family 2 protein [Thermoleophilia bacterium]|nr:glycosyltransferase family 2 protein [Thermoleophilia bacterium]
MMANHIPPCAVVIVAHDSGRLLADAVASAVEQAGASQVWVVDAESVDGSVEALRTEAMGVHVVPVANTGFAAANNRGIEETDSPFVLLLNPDAWLCAGALEALLSTAEARPQAGIVGALVVDPAGSVQAGSFGRFPSFGNVLGLHVRRAYQRLRGSRDLSPKAPASTVAVDWVTGAALLARRAAIQEVGPMDEGFFMYYEDTDWCHRMRDHAWEVLLEPAARVVHHRGGSTPPGTPTAEVYRASFYRYCDLYGLWGLKTFSRIGLSLRGLCGGER